MLLPYLAIAVATPLLIPLAQLAHGQLLLMTVRRRPKR